MADSDLLLGAPVLMGLAYWGRKSLELPERLPTWSRRLNQLWWPAGAILVLGLAGGTVHQVANWLDTLFVAVMVGLGVAACWRLRAWRPALWIGLGLLPLAVGLALDTLLTPFLHDDSPDWLQNLDGLAFVWLGICLLVARSNKKQQAADATRLQEAAQAQRLVEAENQTLEYEVQQRTAAFSQLTDALRTTLAELQATQAQLVQREKMASLGELTAGIAHEIQNPLNFVNNFADVSAELVAELEAERARPQRDAAAEAELLADLRQNLQRIGQHGQRASGIVRGMLAHSRAGSGERQPVDVNALAEEYLRLAYHGLRAKDKTFNTKLETSFAPGLPKVEAVPGDLGRVLLNLFTNAFYAVQKRQQSGEAAYQPTVRLATSCLAGQVGIVVADNGTGMSPEVQAKVFQPFFTTKPSGEGTGLGLSLSHDIIAKGHGGTLAVESQAGQGSTFTVRLPQ